MPKSVSEQLVKLTSSELDQWHKDNGARVKPVIDHIAVIEAELSESEEHFDACSVEWQLRHEAAEARNGKLREALEFYANEEANYDNDGIVYQNASHIFDSKPDFGAIARQALEADGGTE